MIHDDTAKLLESLGADVHLGALDPEVIRQRQVKLKATADEAAGQGAIPSQQ